MPEGDPYIKRSGIKSPHWVNYVDLRDRWEGQLKKCEQTAEKIVGVCQEDKIQGWRWESRGDEGGDDSVAKVC